jgi:large subunit ribosomal protein L15
MTSLTLEQLSNSSRPHKRTKVVGRGPGSGHGKTSCRGHKGAGSRSGYKVRAGTEGGGFALYRKLPTRGFTNARFAKKYHIVNLDQIQRAFDEGEVVNLESLRDRGLLRGNTYGVKILGKGSLTKKVSIEAQAFSEGTEEKLKKLGISYTCSDE